MIFGADELSDIMGIDIEPFVINRYSEVYELVDLAKEKGCQAVISGRGVCNYVNSIGLKSIFIKTGKESLWQAITEAKRVANISRRQQERAELFKNILDYSNEGVIAVDTRNKITIVNSAAQSILK